MTMTGTLSRVIKSKTVIGAVIAAAGIIFKAVDPTVSQAVIAIVQGVGVVLAAVGLKHGQEKAVDAATARTVEIIKNQIY